LRKQRREKANNGEQATTIPEEGPLREKAYEVDRDGIKYKREGKHARH